MNQNPLPQKTLRLWQLRVALVGGVPFLLCLFFLYLSKWFLLPAIFVLVLSLWLIFWYFPRYFQSYEVQFPQNAIVIRRGVFIRSSHIMPFSKLVYVQSFSTPLSKSMGLAAISLKAARSSLFIPELSDADVQLFIHSVTKEGDN